MTTTASKTNGISTEEELLLKAMREEADDAKALIESGGEIVNHFIGFANGQQFYLVTPWESDRSRLAMLAGVKALFARERVTRYCQTSEAWMGTDEDVEPSKDPRREEALIIAGATSDGIKHLKIYPILRDAGGKRALGEAVPNMEQFAGTSLSLLDGVPPSPLH